MRGLGVLLCVAALIWIAKAEENATAIGELKLSEQIRAILEHYKQDDPVGIPGAPIPDPMPIPDMKKSFSVATMEFKKMQVLGMSKFRVQHVKADLAALKVNAALTIDRLVVIGNYTMRTWVSRSQGPFTVILTNVSAQGFATLAVERDGKLRAQDINMDIAFGTINMNFEKLGFMGTLFQSIINSVGTFLFDSIKPFVLKEAYSKARVEINTNLEKVAGDHNFPNSISPLDMAIADLRKKVREMGYDPYAIADYNQTAGLFQVKMTNTWLTGLSSFYRVGNMTFAMENNTLFAGFNVGTQRLKGVTHWELLIGGGMMEKLGTASFTVEHLKVEFKVSQKLDIRNRPVLNDIQLDLGNIQARCDGAGTLDYFIEFFVNILPNLLRYQIMDAIEGPVKTRVQEIFNSINLEKEFDEKLPQLDNLENGFQIEGLLS